MPHHALPFLLAALTLAADPPPPAPAADPLSALESAVCDAIARAEPSVVAITREKGEGDETTAVRGRQPAAVAGERLRFEAEDFLAMPGDFGSGVVVGDEGEILTTYHLVHGAARIRVRATQRQEFDAEIIAADPRSDLAVIVPRLAPNMPKPTLKPLPLGDAGKMRKGTFLIALGNPYNTARDGKASASLGILANVARKIPTEPDYTLPLRAGQPPLRHQPTLLQLDSKLNLGMSGGAVVNLRGELVGLSTTGGSSEGFDAQAGYAIPMDALGRRAVEALKQGKEVEYGLLGIMLDRQGSNRIENVRPGTPASDANLVAQDEIYNVAGIPVADKDELTLAISTVAPGTSITLKIRREGKELERKLVVAKFPTAPQAIFTNRPASWRGMRVDFSSILIATAGFNDETGRRVAKGVGVLEVEPGSPADDAGLKTGHIITEVEGRPVRSPDEFVHAVADKKGPITLTAEMGMNPKSKFTVK